MPATLVQSLGDLFSNGQLVPLVVACIAIFLLMSSMRRMQKRWARRSEGSVVPSDRPKPASTARESHQLRRDMNDLLVELQDLARKINAEMETRFAKLEAAIRDADRRIAALNRLTRQFNERAARHGDPVEDHDARHTVVYELADAGFSPVEIARDLGKTPGEVELILNLRRHASVPSARLTPVAEATPEPAPAPSPPAER